MAVPPGDGRLSAKRPPSPVELKFMPLDKSCPLISQSLKCSTDSERSSNFFMPCQIFSECGLVKELLFFQHIAVEESSSREPETFHRL